MKKKALAGDNIAVSKGMWKFDKKTSVNFDKHVSKSVPLYNEGHKLIADLSDFFIGNNSVVYDIGCSTGSLIEKILINNSKKNFKIYGIDNERSMIDLSKKRLKKFSQCFFKCGDITKTNFRRSDLIISYYTIQFIHPKLRQLLINKLYESLNWGGALIFFEKVRAPDARFQDIMTQLYNEFKMMNGYSKEEILSKTLSLKGVLEPFSTQGNLDMLKRSGFVDITTISKYICFEGFLAIK